MSEPLNHAGELRNSAQLFNELCHIPNGPIDLGDGRELRVQYWNVTGDTDTSQLGGVQVKVEGCIVPKR